jgi:DNA replication protein DnaC
MGELTGIKNDLKQYQGKSQPGRLINSSTEIKNCKICNREFETKVYLINGRPVFREECPECFEKTQESRLKESFKKEVDQLDQEVRLSWLKQYGLIGNLQTKTFDNFNRVLQPKAYDVFKKYNGGSITLLSSGVYGIGKTHLVCAFANDIIGKTKPVVVDERNHYIQRVACPVYFTTEIAIFDKVRYTYVRNQNGDEELEREIYDKLANVPFLIIDDVGKIKPKDYSFLQGIHYRILDTRSINNKPIIFTTNLDFDALEQHLGGANADRLRGMCGENMIKMSGKSQR